MRLLFCFFLLLSTLCATDEISEELPTFSRTPSVSQLIAGIVHPLNGSLSLSEQDMVIKGAQEISVHRFYSSPYMPYSFDGHWDCDLYHRIHYLKQHYEGWKLFPHISLWRDRKKSKIYLTTPYGANYTFEILQGLSDTYGISNINSDESPSAHYDPRNIRIQSEGNEIRVFFPDGAERIYLQKKAHSLRFLLQKEILPNGKILKYHYTHDQLSLIESCDPQERFTYASLRIQGSPEEGKVLLTSSTKQQCTYTYESRHYKGRFRYFGEKVEYNELTPPLLIAASTPHYREEKSHYSEHYHILDGFSGKEKHFCLISSPFGENEKAHFRIDKIYFPVGINDKPVLCHEMSYKPPLAGEKEGETLVKHHDGSSTLYRFSKELLTQSIQYFGKEGTLQKEKIFSWNEKQWLSSIELRDGKQKLFYRKSYEYDSFGNPILEKFTGDLQGNGVIESYTIKRTFSHEGRNLLLSEEREEGKVTTYTYLPNTNLITKKECLGFCEKYSYDDCHNLIKISIEDDSGSKRITEYTLRQKEPFLHMPEWIEERYIEQGMEKLLRRIHWEYDTYGNVVKERYYDAHNQYAYTLNKKYDEQGNLLSETTPLGVTKSYSYDARGRCLTESTSRKSIERDYDTRGRIVAERHKGKEGILQETGYLYQKDDQPTEVIDPYENHFFYQYDPLTSHITTSALPSLGVETYFSYDALGRKISHTDADGQTTYYSYNAYGSPTEVRFPEGGKEHYRYSKNGKLLTYQDRDGLITSYSYDLLGRIISEKKGNGEKHYLYQGAHLVEESDSEGNRTCYFYDGAGRKIEEERSGRRTLFTYDALGHLATIDQGKVVTHFKRDLEGNILEEKQGDAHKISYSYTPEGEVDHITRYIDGKEAVESFTYDSLGRKIESKDSLGHKTKITYEEQVVTTEDPQGVVTKEFYDALHRIVRKESRSPEGMLLSLWEKVYDPYGNLIDWKESLYKEGEYLGEQRTHFGYTKEHRLKTLTRAYGTPLARTTSFSYTPGGKMAKKTLPNGVTLSYEYHPLGHLQRITSSDKSIHHRFRCNKKGELLEAYDEVTKKAIRREVDPFGNVIKECFPYLAIEKEFDEQDRMIKFFSPAVGSVVYEYDPFYLSKVSRFSPEEKLLYSHQYEKYDLDGNVLLERSIDSGEIKHKYDRKGRVIAIHAPSFSQKCKYDLAGNLIESISDRTTSFGYDGLSQLTAENERRYSYDSLHNRREKNDRSFTTNSLNELDEFSYDLCGNQLEKNGVQYRYDALNRLIEAREGETNISFQYDPLGRRLQKIVSKKGVEVDREYYLYVGQDEVGAITAKGKARNFRVLGRALHEKMAQTIAIELEGKPYVPMIDVQGNICKLVDPTTKKVFNYSFTAFGEELQREEEKNPWRYASKRHDDDLKLIYFGKRYYDPEFGRWLTTDPCGFVDGMNLYQYALNNPYSYYDPNGEFIFMAAIPFALFFTPAIVTICTEAVLAGLATWGVYEGAKIAISELGASYTLSEWGWHSLKNNLGLSGFLLDYSLMKAQDGEETKDSNQKPPYDGKELGNDPTKCPGDGFEWRGRGSPGSGKGSWHNPITEESIYPDLNHPPPVKPHWDYFGPNFPNGVRLNIDGTWGAKNKCIL